MLIVNADDWGRDQQTTDRTLECVMRAVVSSVSAMVFMGDSERARDLAGEHGVDAGLHLNLTMPFTAGIQPRKLEKEQNTIARFLHHHAFARAMYNPCLAQSFAYVVTAQIEEYARLYGRAPQRIDGHHHMHLSANVLFSGLLPAGILMRRHFSYEPGEKAVRNGLFRAFSSAALARRYRTTDYFFSLAPIEPETRLNRIFSLAREYSVEVETHPVNPEEYRFLTGGAIFRWTGECPIATSFFPAHSQVQ